MAAEHRVYRANAGLVAREPIARGEGGARMTTILRRVPLARNSRGDVVQRASGWRVDTGPVRLGVDEVPIGGWEYRCQDDARTVSLVQGEWRAVIREKRGAA